MENRRPDTNQNLLASIVQSIFLFASSNRAIALTLRLLHRSSRIAWLLRLKAPTTLGPNWQGPFSLNSSLALALSRQCMGFRYVQNVDHRS